MSIAGTHLNWFAASEAVSGLMGTDVFDEESVARQEREVLAQVRRLCRAAR